MFTGNNNGKAKEAISFYTGLFPDSKVQGIMEYAEGGAIRRVMYNTPNLM